MSALFGIPIFWANCLEAQVKQKVRLMRMRMMKNMKGRSPPPETWLGFIEKSIRVVSMTDRMLCCLGLALRLLETWGGDRILMENQWTNMNEDEYDGRWTNGIPASDHAQLAQGHVADVRASWTTWGSCLQGHQRQKVPVKRCCKPWHLPVKARNLVGIVDDSWDNKRDRCKLFS